MFENIDQSLYDSLSRRPVVGVPRRIPADAYAAARDEYISRVAPRGTVRCVYEIGSVSVPGLSDLDLIAVMRDRTRDRIDRYGIAGLSETSQYVFSHDPILADGRTFATLPIWFPTAAARLVQGEPLSLDATGVAGDVMATIHVVQMLLCYYVQLLRHFTFGAQLYERATENLVKGLCNTIALWETVEPSCGESSWAKFAASYLPFRARWFELAEDPRRAAFLRFVAHSTAELAALMERVAARLSEVWFEDADAAPEGEIHLGQDRIVFTRAWRGQRALIDALGGAPLEFPSVYGLFMRAYGQGLGPVADHVRRTCDGIADVRFRSATIAAAVRRHGMALDDIVSFHRAKFRTAANPFVTFWAPHHPSRIVRAYDRVSNRLSRAADRWRVQERIA